MSRYFFGEKMTKRQKMTKRVISLVISLLGILGVFAWAIQPSGADDDKQDSYSKAFARSRSKD